DAVLGRMRTEVADPGQLVRQHRDADGSVPVLAVLRQLGVLVTFHREALDRDDWPVGKRDASRRGALAALAALRSGGGVGGRGGRRVGLTRGGRGDSFGDHSGPRVYFGVHSGARGSSCFPGPRSFLVSHISDPSLSASFAHPSVRTICTYPNPTQQG